MKFVVAGVILLAIIGGGAFWYISTQNKKTAEKREVTLNVWGLWEDDSFIKPAIDEYKKSHPDITVNYKYNISQNYRPRVQAQIKEGQGPDILMIGNSWLPMFLNSGQLAQAPAEIITPEQYLKDFYPVERDDFTNYLILKAAIDGNSQILEKDKQKKTDESFLKNGKIYGMARGIDGLGMYMNMDILTAANLNPPSTWNEFREAAIKATVIDQEGVIKTAGAAIGLTGNVDHWSDILGLLFLQQPGAKIDNPNDQNGVDVLKFYTGFVTDDKAKVWDLTMEHSTQAFAGGRLAFYFAPSWRAHELRVLNPQLNFKIGPVPQLANKKVGYANYWGYGVSAGSLNQKEAWEFLKFLTSAETEKLLYQEASKSRLFGLPYSRVDLQKELTEDPLVGAFVNQGPNYKSWYLNSDTKDQALNDQIIKYYEDAVNSISSGGDSRTALEIASKGISQVLGTFVKPQASPSPK